MIQSIYTSVSNADIVPCGKKGLKVSSEPIPLLRNNYLGEYRTELEKAKVRKNLGIADEQSLLWGNIKGHIEELGDLIDYIKTMQEYTTKLNGSVTNVKEALDYVLKFVTNFKGEEAAIEDILDNISNIHSNLTNLLNDLEINSTNIGDLQSKHAKVELDIANINKQIEKLNQDLIDINVDDKIQAWVTAKINSSNTLVLGDSLEVKISETENNAVSNEGGLFVLDLSVEMLEANKYIGELQTKVQNISDTYVTKDQLGSDGDYSFVKQEVFNTHTLQADAQFGELRDKLSKTVKTGEDGHVDILYVNTISKDNDDTNIKITDSFEVTDNIPLDIRLVKENLEELYKISADVCYPGMGVIVNSLSALYILRPPAEGVVINQEYVANANNWKCPEDLVTVALTRQEYESLEEINPYVFYYIYEDEITRTLEPKREEYLTEEEFLKEWLKWVDSLKTLSQQYMSASWGVDIENKLGKKASSQSVSLLKKEIDNIKGNGNNPSLESLNNSVQELQAKDDTFKERLDEILIKHEDIEQGRLVSAEKEINKVKEDLSNYLTKDYIQDSSNEFIFVKDSDYLNDLKEFKESLSALVTTQEVVTRSLVLQDTSITIKEDHLNVNSKIIAEISDIPVLEVLTQTEYDEKEKSGNIDEKTYYYTYDGDVRLVTNTDLIKESEKLQRQINVLFLGGTSDDIEGTLNTIFLPIETWNNFLELYEKISNLALNLELRLLKIEPLKLTHFDGTLYITGDPERCYQERDTVYINQTVYTDTIKFE